MDVPRPVLIATQVAEDPAGIVLVLHGGREKGRGPVRRNQLAVLRMIPIARVIARSSDRLVVLRLLTGVRGWNGADASPVADVEWAVAEAQRRHGPDLPICLVGHSMGGRAAFRAAGHPSVRSVVGLAPWLPAGEPTGQLGGRKVLIVHGSADRMTDPQGSAAFARALEGKADQVTYVQVPGEKHAMLRRREVFDGLAAGFAAGTLLDDAAPFDDAPAFDDAAAFDDAGPREDGRRAQPRVGPNPGRTELPSLPNLLRRALAGEAWLVA